MSSTAARSPGRDDQERSAREASVRAIASKATFVESNESSRLIQGRNVLSHETVSRDIPVDVAGNKVPVDHVSGAERIDLCEKWAKDVDEPTFSRRAQACQWLTWSEVRSFQSSWWGHTSLANSSSSSGRMRRRIPVTVTV